MNVTYTPKYLPIKLSLQKQYHTTPKSTRDSACEKNMFNQ
jgi:hypothetical protein